MQKWRDVTPPFYCIDKVEIRAPQEAADDSARIISCGASWWKKKCQSEEMCLPVVVLFAVLRGWTWGSCGWAISTATESLRLSTEPRTTHPLMQPD
jgi:hypothetical protein